MWRDDKANEAGGVALLQPVHGGTKVEPRAAPKIPDYLIETYNWAYVTPKAVRFFERPWLINAIVWGNYNRLCEGALKRLDGAMRGKVLQLGCAYGDFSPRLAERVASLGGSLDVVDVLPAQIDNLLSKLTPEAPATVHRMDSAEIDFDDESFDAVTLFLLLHEQPNAWRERTLSEAWRVLRPGGRIVLVDYARPFWWNPLRYLFAPPLAWLEPFALELWRRPVDDFLPRAAKSARADHGRMFGGLYQLITLEKPR